jgi:hypothetical protein
MQEVVRNLLLVYPDAVVKGHRDMKRAVPKLCPCFDVASDESLRFATRQGSRVKG